MTSAQAQQSAICQSPSASLYSASYRDVSVRLGSPVRWTTIQVLYVWISSAGARELGIETVKHDLYLLAKRSTCGVALYHAVAAKLEEIRNLSKSVNDAAGHNRHSEYDALTAASIAAKETFDKWIKRWELQISFSEHKHDPNGRTACSMETVIKPKDDLVMATLQPYRTLSKPERRSSALSQGPEASKNRSRRSSVVSNQANRRGSQGGVLL